jgi:hypothetical protein
MKFVALPWWPPAFAHSSGAPRSKAEAGAFLSAFRQIVDELVHNPSRFGEALYRLPAMRMQVRCGVIRPLVVDFAVCEDRPVVFIKGGTLLDPPPGSVE